MPHNTASTNYIWQEWTTQTLATNNQVVWSKWITSTDTTINRYYPDRRPYNQWAKQQEERIVRSAAEIAEIERVHQEALAAARKRAEAAERAKRRAEELLMRFLTPEQQRVYKQYGHIFVCGKSGTNYRISRNSIAGNIHQLDKKGNPIARYCAHVPYGEVPDPDNHLTQLLMLKHHEEDFLRVANRSPMAH